jgi:hypothetical protein
MTIKYSKMLAIAGVVVLTSMMVAPTHAEDPVVPVATTSVSTTGILHVIQNVINDNGGTAVASDFTISVKHYASDVFGSPFQGITGAGVTFVLEPGTYLVTQEPKDCYFGSWSSLQDNAGLVQLVAGQEITLTRNSNDCFVETVVVEEPTTEDGGLLPNTATPWFNFLLVGSLIAAAGALGVRKSVRLHKAI